MTSICPIQYLPPFKMLLRKQEKFLIFCVDDKVLYQMFVLACFIFHSILGQLNLTFGIKTRILGLTSIEYYDILATFCVFLNFHLISGTWLAPVRLNRVHDIRFDTEYRSRGCNNRHIISHKQTINDMFNKYEQLTQYNRLCVEEQVRRLSFDYNWKGKPSECCRRRKDIP